MAGHATASVGGSKNKDLRNWKNAPRLDCCSGSLPDAWATKHSSWRLTKVSARSWMHQYDTLSARSSDRTTSYISPRYSNSREWCQRRPGVPPFRGKLNCTSSLSVTPACKWCFTASLISCFRCNRMAWVPQYGQPNSIRRDMAKPLLKGGRDMLYAVNQQFEWMGSLFGGRSSGAALPAGSGPFAIKVIEWDGLVLLSVPCQFGTLVGGSGTWGRFGAVPASGSGTFLTETETRLPCLPFGSRRLG